VRHGVGADACGVQLRGRHNPALTASEIGDRPVANQHFVALTTVGPVGATFFP
jgi:hypothetical protein